MGITYPRLPHSIEGGGGSSVSIPFGASGGTLARYGNRSNMILRTGRVKSKKASSMDAFSLKVVNHHGALTAGTVPYRSHTLVDPLGTWLRFSHFHYDNNLEKPKQTQTSIKTGVVTSIPCAYSYQLCPSIQAPPLPPYMLQRAPQQDGGIFSSPLSACPSGIFHTSLLDS